MHHLKKCFKCAKDKPITEYYRHDKMSAGVTGKCKECTKEAVRENRLKNIEYYRAYDLDRSKRKERKAMSIALNKRWRQTDPRITACHNAVTRAVRKGDLVPENCKTCGSDKVLAHHESYDRKLDVVWYCQPCHKKRHKEMKALRISPY